MNDFAEAYKLMKKKDINGLDIMFKNGLDVNICNNDRDNLLVCAIYLKNSQMAKYLIKKGIDINTRMKLGLTALQIAVGMKQNTIVNMLLNCNVDLKVIDDYGNNAADESMVYNKDIIQILAKRGLKPRLINRDDMFDENNYCE